MPQINLVSLRTLENFVNELNMLASKGNCEIDEVESWVQESVQRASYQLEQAHQALRTTKERLVELEEPDHWDYEQVYDATFKLTQAQNHHYQLENAAHRLLICLTDTSVNLQRAYGTAQHLLENSICSAKDYLSITLDNPSSNTPVVNKSNASSGGRDDGLTSQGTLNPIANLPLLPNNLTWVSLEKLNWQDFPDDLDYKKVPAEKIRLMMKTFMEDLIPILYERPNISVDELRKIDKFQGRDFDDQQFVSSRSMALAYQCILGVDQFSDVIALNPSRSASPDSFDFTSGRHRALIAKKMGWSHIPARVI